MAVGFLLYCGVALLAYLLTIHRFDRLSNARREALMEKHPVLTTPFAVHLVP
jgi:hypothetical protein